MRGRMDRMHIWLHSKRCFIRELLLHTYSVEFYLYLHYSMCASSYSSICRSSKLHEKTDSPGKEMSSLVERQSLCMGAGVSCDILTDPLDCPHRCHTRPEPSVKHASHTSQE